MNIDDITEKKQISDEINQLINVAVKVVIEVIYISFIIIFKKKKFNREFFLLAIEIFYEWQR